MKHNFREHPVGIESEQFLAWLEDETVQLLRRSYGDGEATKSAIFLFAERAYEAHMPETQIGDLFGRCVVRAGFQQQDEPAAFSWLEHFAQFAAKVHGRASDDIGGT